MVKQSKRRIVFDPTQAFGEPGVTRAQRPSTAPDFDGDTYITAKDKVRLTGQLKRVYETVKDGRWLTLNGIAARTSDPQASISAQLRNLRKPRFGAYDIRKRRLGNLFEYTCVGKLDQGQERLW